MKEYIEREAILKEVEEKKRQAKEIYPRRHFVVGDVVSCILSAPAEDVAPVVYGKWEEVEDFPGEYHWKCSACGAEWCFIEGTPEENGSYYCPHCGAKMDL